MKRVLIFDYDGVIVDSLNIFMTLFINACKKHGWKQISSKDGFLSLFNENMYENMKKVGMSKQDILTIILEVKNGLLHHLNDLPLFSHMKETLEILSHDHILCITTSNETTVVDRYLNLHQITGFQDIFGSDIHPSKTKKIELIKQKYPKKTYVYIGDTIGDILEGKKAKIYTIGVTWGWHSKEKIIKSNPDYLVECPKELINIVSQLP